jgi:hypothetical protein
MLGSCHDKNNSLTILCPIEKKYFNILHAVSIAAAVISLTARGRRLRKISIIYPRCGCPRCVDPTEFGTNTSGLPCGSCQGLLLPQVTTTESDYRVSSGGVHFTWMSPPVIYKKRYYLAIFVTYPVGSHGRFIFPARYLYYLQLGLLVKRREGRVRLHKKRNWHKTIFGETL